MQKLLLSSLVSISFSAMAQFHSYTESFETKQQLDTTIQVLSLSGDWQIGKPIKTNFSEARTGIRAVMTDTSKSCSANTTSELVIQLSPATRSLLFFGFHHQLQLSEGVDSAKIDFSFDQGTTWLNLKKTKEYVHCHGMMYQESSGFNEYGTLSKNLDNWTPVDFTIGISSAVRLEECYDHSLYYSNIPIQVRFTFFSNTSVPTKGGWIIDDLLFSSQVVGGLHGEARLSAELVKIAPNPSSGQPVLLSITHPSLKIIRWSLEDLNGTTHQSGSGLEVATANLPHGVYLLRILTSEGWVFQKLAIN